MTLSGRVATPPRQDPHAATLTSRPATGERSIYSPRAIRLDEWQELANCSEIEQTGYRRRAIDELDGCIPAVGLPDNRAQSGRVHEGHGAEIEDDPVPSGGDEIVDGGLEAINRRAVELAERGGDNPLAARTNLDVERSWYRESGT
jgi:hypothetical protein